MKLAFHLSLFVAFASPVFADQPVGVASVNVLGDDQMRPLSLSLWYPGDGGTPEDVGANAVFTGVAAGRDAALPEDRLPVVFVSHGGLRSAADSGAWLTAALARAGYLAIEVNAPRPATAAVAVDEIWQRPNDVSRALDAVLSDPIWSERVDQSRISVVGFALGGTAALVLGGGEIDPDAFVGSCTEAAAGPDCGWYQAQKVTLGSVDRAALVQPRRDARAGSIVAVAPEYIDALSGGISSIDVPAFIVSLGSDAMPQAAAQPIGVTQQAIFPDAVVSDAFQVCTPAGPAILAEDGGDPALCGLSTQARQQTHGAVANAIVTFLEEVAN